MNTKEILVAALALIDTPEKWTKGHFTERNNSGQMCYCLMGAIERATNYDIYMSCEAAKAIRVQCEIDSIVSMNDLPKTTHADVLSLLDRTIAACP